MGIFKKFSYNWNELAKVVNGKIDEKIFMFNSDENLLGNNNVVSMFVFQSIEYASLLTEHNYFPDKYDKWLVNECNTITDECMNYLDNTKKIRQIEVDKIIRVMAFSAVGAYCSQFDVNDSEFFYYLYEKVLQDRALMCRTKPH